MSAQLVWFRRDLRLADHPALAAAAANGAVVPLVVLDPALLGAVGRRADRYLASVAALRETTDGALVIRSGDPRTIVAEVAEQAGADAVHVSAETTPYGRARDRSVAAALTRAGRELVATGSPYAVTPGRVRTAAGAPYRVYTPFARAWRGHGWRGPAQLSGPVRWLPLAGEDLPAPAGPVPAAGERAALLRWRAFATDRLDGYAEGRDRPDLTGTSELSAALKFGEIHPRTVLGDLADRRGTGSARFVAELAWREFYADVLWHRPDSAWADLRPELAGLHYDSGSTADLLVAAWRVGRTGYPFVDAGMRQLRETGWMHNRLRMVTASFLTKDLHVWWPVGARHFLAELFDGDLASNNHGWQWVAGTGTDAAPYFRVLNPVRQGMRFDPHGDYVRRWVPELRHLSGGAVHEPWRAVDGFAHGYPQRVVDHDEQRRVALERYRLARAGSRAVSDSPSI